jgi:transposase
VLELNAQLADLDTRITERFRANPDAVVLISMVGIGELLGAEFLAATGGSLDAFASADHLAGYAGLAPTTRDSGSASATCTARAATTVSSSACSTPPR